MVSEVQAARIRAEYRQGGSVAAAAELRRMFPGLADNEETKRSARLIAGWKPLELPEKAKIRRPGR